MLRRGPWVHLVAPFFCVLGHPSDTASVNAVSISSPGQAFSTAFHFRLAPLEWFCCRQTVLWILGLEWAVTFCNWKFITQRQFHWALSLFNTQSLEYCGSCGFRWHYLYCPHVLNYEGGLFSSLGCSLKPIQLRRDKNMSVFPSPDILPSSIPGFCPCKTMTCL